MAVLSTDFVLGCRLRVALRVIPFRIVVVALAGPNGAGKTTFYHAHLRPAGLRFLNADEIARELEMDAYEAARVVTELRQELVRQRESFVLENRLYRHVQGRVVFHCTQQKKAYENAFACIAASEQSLAVFSMAIASGTRQAGGIAINKGITHLATEFF
jgi:predicted ABC-type ATPase